MKILRKTWHRNMPTLLMKKAKEMRQEQHIVTLPSKVMKQYKKDLCKPLGLHIYANTI